MNPDPAEEVRKMRTSTVTTPPAARLTPAEPAVDRRDRHADRYGAVNQYSLAKILTLWAAAAVPMGLLAWVGTPLLEDQLSTRDPFIDALMICFNVGLLWILALVLIMVRREQGSLGWSSLRDALWLRQPQDPRTGTTRRTRWGWWALLFVVLTAVINLGFIDPEGPLPRDFPNALSSDRLESYFSGNWGGFALLVGVAVLAPVVEELFFRGLLLPRMRAAFGKRDFLVNGAMFGLYHVHQPWGMPASVIDGVVTQAYPARRFRSIWISLITHTAPSVLIIGVLLGLVLK
jgi:membrane protease YdiL (CAAX protease family)